MYNLRKYILTAAICIFGINSLYALNWGKDIESALKKAQEEKKCVFLLFTGSDWCPYCITLEKKVLSKSAFKDYAEKNLILVKYDKRKKASEKTQEEIKEVMQKYGAAGFPTICILDPENNTLGKMGTSDDPDKFVAQLKQLTSKYTPSEDGQDTPAAAKDTAVIPSAAAPITAATEEYPPRTWTNIQGKKVEGTLITFDKDSAVIMNKKRKKISVPRKSLSAEDNTYLDTLNSDDI